MPVRPLRMRTKPIKSIRVQTQAPLSRHPAITLRDTRPRAVLLLQHECAASLTAPLARDLRGSAQVHENTSIVICLGGLEQVEDGACVPGLTIKPFASTADVEALMCSASATQHAAGSHLVLSVYAACKDHTTGVNITLSAPLTHPSRASQMWTASLVDESVLQGFTGRQGASAAAAHACLLGLGSKCMWVDIGCMAVQERLLWGSCTWPASRRLKRLSAWGTALSRLSAAACRCAAASRVPCLKPEGSDQCYQHMWAECWRAHMCSLDRLSRRCSSHTVNA